MNQMPQQPSGYQSNQNFQTPSQYEPIGYVQSHYQGQLSQPNFGRPTQSIVGNPQGGYQANQSFSMPMQQTAPSQFGMQQQGFSNQYVSHGPVQSHASSPATAFGDVGPVIAHFGGYQAQNNSFYQPSQQQFKPVSSQSQSFNAGGYGMTPTHSQTSQHPVYQATNAYSQAGPVISRLGWQAEQGNR